MKRKKDKILYYLLIIITLIAFVFLIKLIKIYDILCYLFDLIYPIIMGFILAWILLPIYNWLNKKIKPKISIILIVLLFIFTYFLIGYFIFPMLISKISSLYSLLEKYLFKAKKIAILNIDDRLFKMNPKDMLASCGGLVTLIINIVLTHIFAFYILYNYEKIKKHVKLRLPTKNKTIILEFADELSFNMRLYIKGIIIDTVVLFAITFIAFSILHLKYSIILSSFIAVTNIIPFVGPYIGGIPAVLIGLNKSKKIAIFIIAFLFISQELESDVINPIIMSKCVKINPLLIVIAVTIMGKIFGILGMIFAVPLLIFIKISMKYIHFKNV